MRLDGGLGNIEFMCDGFIGQGFADKQENPPLLRREIPHWRCGRRVGRPGYCIECRARCRQLLGFTKWPGGRTSCIEPGVCHDPNPSWFRCFGCCACLSFSCSHDLIGARVSLEITGLSVTTGHEQRTLVASRLASAVPNPMDMMLRTLSNLQRRVSATPVARDAVVHRRSDSFWRGQVSRPRASDWRVRDTRICALLIRLRLDGHRPTRGITPCTTRQRLQHQQRLQQVCQAVLEVVAAAQRLPCAADAH